MSKEALEQMFQAASEDPNLRQKLENASGYTEAVIIGAENGFNFTEEEAQVFVSEQGLMEVEEGELSNEDLEAVAGGFSFSINGTFKISGW
jgi:predicted ribosomally synthesized peptide with nif11-like leader